MQFCYNGFANHPAAIIHIFGNDDEQRAVVAQGDSPTRWSTLSGFCRVRSPSRHSVGSLVTNSPEKSLHSVECAAETLMWRSWEWCAVLMNLFSPPYLQVVMRVCVYGFCGLPNSGSSQQNWVERGCEGAVRDPGGVEEPEIIGTPALWRVARGACTAWISGEQEWEETSLRVWRPPIRKHRLR